MSWTWEELRALPSETVTVDIHCVTKWSKLDTVWTGVSLDTLLDGVETSAEYVIAFCDGGYTTNLPLDDVTGGKAWIAFELRRRAARAGARRPGAAARAAPLLLEEREVGARARAADGGRAGLLGELRLPQLRRPVERAALPRRLTWQLGTVVELVDETARPRGASCSSVPDWPGHRAGQHVDVRLTAEDGYQAQRSYSIASAPEDEHLVLTVERLDDGEVSPYLIDELRPGDELELRGPIGGYFVWEELARRAAAARRRRLRRRAVPLDAAPPPRRSRAPCPVRLLYSARSLAEVIYRDELCASAQPTTVDVRFTLTREQPEGWQGYARRIDRSCSREVAWPPDERPLVYVCGPTGFVETAAGHSSRSATSRARSGPNASARPGQVPGEVRPLTALDGNAIAGPLSGLRRAR